jgi:hypothetical protein
MGPYMTTTVFNRKNNSKKTKRQIQAEKEHDKYLRKMGVHPDQLEAKKIEGVGVGTQGELIPLSAADYRSREGSIPSAPTNLPAYDPSMAKREPQVYNGERKLLGIATLHKSNMVPVFSKDDAIEIAKMRRG